MIVLVPPTSGGNVGPPSVVVVVDVVVVVVVDVDVLVVDVVVLVVVLVVDVVVLVVVDVVLVVDVVVLVVVDVDVLVVDVVVLVVVDVDVLVVDVVVLVVVDVVVLVVDVVVVGHGSGEHEPAPRSRPPSVAHCVGSSTTQVNAPMGEPGRQHCTGAAVVVVVLVVVVEVVDVVVLVVVVDVVLVVVVDVVLVVVVDAEVELVVDVEVGAVVDVEVELVVDVEVGAVVDVEVVLVDVVVVGTTHVPSEGGRFTLNSRVSLLVRVPVGNATLYESPPPPISSRMQPPVPRSGGTTDIGANRAVPLTLMMKTPLPLFLICADLIGPCSPRESLYLKPFAALPDQKGFPLVAVPCGSAKVCCVGLSPSARTVSVAPSTVGSPTRGFGLDFSFALPTKLRLSAVLGFLTVSWLPRIG